MNSHLITGTFYSGKETHWIAQAKFQPQSNHVFASCDYDGVGKLQRLRNVHALCSQITTLLA